MTTAQSAPLGGMRVLGELGLLVSEIASLGERGGVAGAGVTS